MITIIKSHVLERIDDVYHIDGEAVGSFVPQVIAWFKRNEPTAKSIATGVCQIARTTKKPVTFQYTTNRAWHAIMPD